MSVPVMIQQAQSYIYSINKGLADEENFREINTLIEVLTPYLIDKGWSMPEKKNEIL